MVLKQGKPATEATSYRPVTLLLVLTKLFEKLLLKILKPTLDEKQLIPTHHFGFRNKHSTIGQVHRITTIVEKTLEEKKPSMAQAFDKVRHEGLFHKIEELLPAYTANC
jgi:hypothetical protein